MPYFFSAVGSARQLLLYPFNAYSLILILGIMLFLSRSPRFKVPVLLLSFFISLRYIFWRGFFTLNTADYIALAISSVLLLAEFYGFLQNLLFYYQSASPSSPSPPEGSQGYAPTVDILITIYNEPEDILLRTIVGCQAQDYPKERFNVYVCDDGGRLEIQELTRRLGCHYITRTDNGGAKAGNINNALKSSSAEVVAIFDCDHIPVRSFLKETVPFFADPKVAIVQVPHHFYNPDIFQRNLTLEKEITNEQDLFFHVIQPGKDSYNSAFFAGSCGLFRKSALDEIGGIITRTITEDIHTSMELHSRGYRSVYLNKDLSAGLVPESSAGYLKQRQRWAKGGIQVFLLDNPLFKKGLSFHQRLQYTASLIFFFHGIPRAVYLSAPLAYLLFSYVPLVTDIKTLLYYFIPHYAATLIAFGMISKGFRNPFWSDVYETLMSFVLTLAAVKTVFKPVGHTFEVTPKGERNERQRLETSIVLPHMILAVLLLVGTIAGVYGLIHGVTDSAPIIISLAWSSYNILILGAAIMSARERPQSRANIRLERSIRCEILLPGKKIDCVTRDISETGLSVRLSEPVTFTDAHLRVNLISDYGETTLLKGRVVRNDHAPDGGFLLGVRFIDMDDGLRKSVICQMLSPEESWSGYHGKSSTRLLAFFVQIFKTASGLFRPRRTLRRLSPRFDFRSSCEIESPDGRAIAAETRDISAEGLSVEAAWDFAVGDEVKINLDRGGRTVSVKGVVVWKAREKRELLGIKFLDAEEVKVLWEETRRVCFC